MRIAIIGTGISGLTAAHSLHPLHELTLWEAGDYVGGHTHTVDVEFKGEQATIDTGFIVFNDWTYPNFIALLNNLEVPWQDSVMSFSVRCDKSGWEYNGGSLAGMFVQKRNLIRPSFLRMIRDILRFNRESPSYLTRPCIETTVGEFLEAGQYGPEFCDRYLIPMGAAIWSCPPGVFRNFPIRFIIEFYKNHGLLSVTHRPTWRVIRHGSREYVNRLIAPFQKRIRLNSPIERVVRHSDRVVVFPRGGPSFDYDHVIFACHADQALSLLESPSIAERELLASFPYQPNDVVLHTDTSVLPRRQGAWAAWNYHIPRETADGATLTYNMNLLQGLQKQNQYLVTLNSTARIDSSRILGQYVYHHPIFTTRRAEAQARHGELINHNRSSFCGAYWGNGFHEDGVNSALAVCRSLDSRSIEWKAASTKESFGTAALPPFVTSSDIVSS